MTFPTEIVFRGPFPIWPHDEEHWLSRHETSCPGIYLFAIPIQGQWRVFYVGEASNIAGRVREHLSLYLSGKYKLYEAEPFSQGRLVLNWEPSPHAERTLAKLDDHRMKLRAMLSQVSIFFADAGKERSVRQRIESAMIKCLRAQSDSDAILENTRLSVSQKDGHFPIEIRCDSCLLGIQQKLMA